MIVYRLKFFLLLTGSKIEFIKDELVSQSYLDEQNLTISEYAINTCAFLSALEIDYTDVVYQCTQSLLEV